MAALPRWFAETLQSSRALDISGWLQDLHDRDWTLWSSSEHDESVKIDLNADSMPISSWPVRLVTEILAAELLYADVWREA